MDVTAIFRNFEMKLEGLKTTGISAIQLLHMQGNLPHLLSDKECELKRRSTQSPIELSEVLEDIPLPMEMNRL